MIDRKKSAKLEEKMADSADREVSGSGNKTTKQTGKSEKR